METLQEVKGLSFNGASIFINVGYVGGPRSWVQRRQLSLFRNLRRPGLTATIAHRVIESHQWFCHPEYEDSRRNDYLGEYYRLRHGYTIIGPWKLSYRNYPKLCFICPTKEKGPNPNARTVFIYRRINPWSWPATGGGQENEVQRFWCRQFNEDGVGRKQSSRSWPSAGRKRPATIISVEMNNNGSFCMTG